MGCEIGIGASEGREGRGRTGENVLLVVLPDPALGERSLFVLSRLAKVASMVAFQCEVSQGGREDRRKVEGRSYPDACQVDAVGTEVGPVSLVVRGRVGVVARVRRRVGHNE